MQKFFFFFFFPPGISDRLVAETLAALGVSLQFSNTPGVGGAGAHGLPTPTTPLPPMGKRKRGMESEENSGIPPKIFQGNLETLNFPTAFEVTKNGRCEKKKKKKKIFLPSPHHRYEVPVVWPTGTVHGGPTGAGGPESILSMLRKLLKFKEYEHLAAKINHVIGNFAEVFQIFFFDGDFFFFSL